MKRLVNKNKFYSSEMKSFLSVLKKNTKPAICHKTIKAAGESVGDEEGRSKNVILCGFEGIAGEDLLGRAETVLHYYYSHSPL